MLKNRCFGLFFSYKPCFAEIIKTGGFKVLAMISCYRIEYCLLSIEY